MALLHVIHSVKEILEEEPEVSNPAVRVGAANNPNNTNKGHGQL
jgi:hypothetical protein